MPRFAWAPGEFLDEGEFGWPDARTSPTSPVSIEIPSIADEQDDDASAVKNWSSVPPQPPCDGRVMGALLPASLIPRPRRAPPQLPPRERSPVACRPKKANGCPAASQEECASQLLRQALQSLVAMANERGSVAAADVAAVASACGSFVAEEHVLGNSSASSATAPIATVLAGEADEARAASSRAEATEAENQQLRAALAAAEARETELRSRLDAQSLERCQAVERADLLEAELRNARLTLADLQQQADSMREEIGRSLPLYETVNGLSIEIRSEPRIDGPLTGTRVRPGERFRVCETLVVQGMAGNPESIVTYLRLADGRGWLFDRKPGFGIMCECVNMAEVARWRGPPTQMVLPESSILSLLRCRDSIDEDLTAASTECSASLIRTPKSCTGARRSLPFSFPKVQRNFSRGETSPASSTISRSRSRAGSWVANTRTPSRTPPRTPLARSRSPLLASSRCSSVDPATALSQAESLFAEMLSIPGESISPSLGNSHSSKATTPATLHSAQAFDDSLNLVRLSQCSSATASTSTGTVTPAASTRHGTPSAPPRNSLIPLNGCMPNFPHASLESPRLKVARSFAAGAAEKAASQLRTAVPDASQVVGIAGAPFWTPRFHDAGHDGAANADSEIAGQDAKDPLAGPSTEDLRRQRSESVQTLAPSSPHRLQSASSMRTSLGSSTATTLPPATPPGCSVVDEEARMQLSCLATMVARAMGSTDGWVHDPPENLEHGKQELAAPASDQASGKPVNPAGTLPSPTLSSGGRSPRVSGGRTLVTALSPVRQLSCRQTPKSPAGECCGGSLALGVASPKAVSRSTQPHQNRRLIATSPAAGPRSRGNVSAVASRAQPACRSYSVPTHK
eukprot:TRINITY_DN6835_c0_g1_i2.p1 TRINITY_DN6835_c0_g1~~TRINITY_DN6835_c0_g1_i2.p1  ORF type:complete len:860 (+),score=134.91 TRINITY_DN6835_c0_g1_i2:194-2773(+)